MKHISPLLRIIGWIGTSCIMLAYALNSSGVIPSVGLWYPLINLVGAILLGIRVYSDKNWANFVLEIFFGIVAIISLGRLLL